MINKNSGWRYMFLLAAICFSHSSVAKNPIVPNMGVNDPHIRIFNDKAYLYATHDKSAKNRTFIMEDWWIWSSDDLVNWKKESVLKPEDTYIGKGFKSAWATDAGTRNGKYYWYFSEKNEQTGVVVGDTPVGPWKDPLGKPMLTKELTPTHEYDISIIEDGGDHYIIFGVWDFYIAKLNDDMISLAEQPKKIVINNQQGPYGKGKTDDKPFVHKFEDTFYLSWGAFYATSKELYGPYDYVDTLLKQESFAHGYDKPTWPNGWLQGRHGSFFEWHNQWYFAYCDISQTGNRYFRDTFISYVHYRENGEIAPIRVDGIGVGEYDASAGAIEAEDFFKASGIVKRDMTSTNFSVQATSTKHYLGYHNIRNIKGKKTLEVTARSKKPGIFIIEVRRGSPRGKLLATLSGDVLKADTVDIYSTKLPRLKSSEDLYLALSGGNATAVRLDKFQFK